jgi:hypothetical protein
VSAPGLGHACPLLLESFELGWPPWVQHELAILSQSHFTPFVPLQFGAALPPLPECTVCAAWSAACRRGNRNPCQAAAAVQARPRPCSLPPSLPRVLQTVFAVLSAAALLGVSRVSPVCAFIILA